MRELEAEVRTMEVKYEEITEELACKGEEYEGETKKKKIESEQLLEEIKLLGAKSSVSSFPTANIGTP